MNKHQSSRREMLKLSALFAGAAVAPTLALNTKSASENSIADQQRFIENILSKHSAGAKTAGTAEIKAFAERFNEVNGLVDYHALFSNIDGEFRLTRAFVKSLRITAKV